MTSQLHRTDAGRWVLLLVAAAATARFAAVCVSAWSATRGDFYATLPGAYAETINPALWNSPDLSDSWAFHLRTYLHGPTQYLTLYPIVFLDSYRTIAAVLLPIYAVMVLAAVWMLWRAMRATTRRPVSFVAVYSATLLFFPVQQALGQREFEVVILVALAAAVWAAVEGRLGLVGVLFAYITGFKYVPVLAVPYFAARRWGRALVGYGLALCVLAVAAQAAFGLPRFFNNNVPGLATEQVSMLQSRAEFCAAWVSPLTTVFAHSNQTYAGLRWGLCNLQDRHPWLPLPAAYLAICLVVAAVGLAGFFRLERAPLDEATERWRRVMEIALLITGYATFFFSHYYYLSALIVPLVVLGVRFSAAGSIRPLALALWALTYVLLGAFVVPAAVVIRIVGVDPWAFYMAHGLYLYGELLLLGLLLREYLTLPVSGDVPIAARRRPAPDLGTRAAAVRERIGSRFATVTFESFHHRCTSRL